MHIPKTLAIDFGTVRIGTAVSLHTLADPLEIIPNNQNAFKRIRQLCDEHQIELVLIGISENEMAQKTKTFASELKKYVDLPIKFADETLSSHAVHQKLLGAKKSKRSGDIDQYAAAEFLQTWIDEQQ